MVIGLQWVRRRQRLLARVVLALFVLTWLQAAAIPCSMADDVGAVTSPAHETGHNDCRYCPPPATSAASAGESHGHCLYPHGPQVDARASAGLLIMLPSATSVVTLAGNPEEVAAGAPPEAAPIARPPIADSYCRRIE